MNRFVRRMLGVIDRADRSSVLPVARSIVTESLSFAFVPSQAVDLEAIHRDNSFTITARRHARYFYRAASVTARDVQ